MMVFHGNTEAVDPKVGNNHPKNIAKNKPSRKPLMPTLPSSGLIRAKVKKAVF
jgi:hypothetical protein